MVERIGREFQLGGHKAAAIAMVLQNAEIYLVSEREPAFAENAFMKPFESLQAAFNARHRKAGRGRQRDRDALRRLHAAAQLRLAHSSLSKKILTSPWTGKHAPPPLGTIGSSRGLLPSRALPGFSTD